jgi:hypothetical protein
MHVRINYLHNKELAYCLQNLVERVCTRRWVCVYIYIYSECVYWHNIYTYTHIRIKLPVRGTSFLSPEFCGTCMHEKKKSVLFVVCTKYVFCGTFCAQKEGISVVCCIHTCMHTCIPMLLVCMDAYINAWCIHVCTKRRNQTKCSLLSTWMHTYIHACIHACICLLSTWMHAPLIHVYIYIYIYIYI